MDRPPADPPLPRRPSPRATSRWALAVGLLACVACQRAEIVIDTPANGSFTKAATVRVEGSVTNVSAPAQASVRVNGQPVAVDSVGRFAVDLAVGAGPFLPILAELAGIEGVTVRDRVVVVVGPSIADGERSEDAIGLRVNDSGLDDLEQVIESSVLTADAIRSALPPNPVYSTTVCIIPGIGGGCTLDVTFRVNVTGLSFADLDLGADSRTNRIRFELDTTEPMVSLSASGIVNCTSGSVTASSLDLTVDTAIEPNAGDPRFVDVSVVGSPSATVTGLDASFNGVCTVLGPVVGLFETAIANQLEDAIEDLVPDLVAELEQALAGFELDGLVGDAIQVDLDAVFDAIVEDEAGVTAWTDASLTSLGIAQGAPDLDASLHVPELPPDLATSPAGIGAFDLATAVSTSALNQLLKAQTESGLLAQDVVEADLGLGGGPLPLTAGLVSLFLPDLAVLPEATPLVLRVRPSLAPLLTGEAGADGSPADLRIAGLEMSLVVLAGTVLEESLLDVAVDAQIGLGLEATEESLVLVTGAPEVDDLLVRVLRNPLGLDVPATEDTLRTLLAFALPGLTSGLGELPIGGLGELELTNLRIARDTGGYAVLYADLVP